MKGYFVMIYTKIKRKIAVCMSVAMLAGCVQPINIGTSCKVSANEAVGDYLVYSPSDTKLDQIADQYESKLSDDVVDIQNLQQNNILKVELTADQAAKLDQNKNVIIEKDTMMTSLSLIHISPIPPIQCVNARQKSVAWHRHSTSLNTVAPVVVKPDTISNSAST